jgi:hypothetical protein
LDRISEITGRRIEHLSVAPVGRLLFPQESDNHFYSGRCVKKGLDGDLDSMPIFLRLISIS